MQSLYASRGICLSLRSVAHSEPIRVGFILAQRTRLLLFLPESMQVTYLRTSDWLDWIFLMNFSFWSQFGQVLISCRCYFLVCETLKMNQTLKDRKFFGLNDVIIVSFFQFRTKIRVNQDFCPMVRDKIAV